MSSVHQTTTSPWASANMLDKEAMEKIEYPSLEGMRVMIIRPDDHYRKKFFGLGPAYIATAMQRCGVEVQAMSCEMWFYDDIEIARILIQSRIKIFGIGAIYPMFKEVERLCRIIRAVVPGATIILGGALPSPVPEFALRKTGADIATIGEAELTIPPLMSALAGEKDLEEVRGIAYIRDGEFFDNGKPNLPSEVTKKEVGWPALDLFPIEHYITAPKFYPFDQYDRVLSIASGRGCPYSCNFCYRVNAYRIRPLGDLLDEMEYLIDRYRLNGFYIVDDLLMLNKTKVKGICEGIINRGMKIKFSISGRVNTVTPEIAKLLKEAGCVSVFYGLESGNQEVLQTMSKKTTLEQICEAIRLTRENGIYCDYALMFGQPGENKETLQDTVNLVKSICYKEYRAFKIFGCVPFPGTGLYDWCKQTGRIIDDEDFYNRYICQDWHLDQIPINMTDLSDSEVQRLFKEANEELSKFYIEEMSSDWIKCFGGDTQGSQNTPKEYIQ
jgi:radical SAM superfamily enzyme YgiQ (UPF0313 family)